MTVATEPQRYTWMPGDVTIVRRAAKFNPNHDERGRFADAAGDGGGAAAEPVLVLHSADWGKPASSRTPVDVETFEKVHQRDKTESGIIVLPDGQIEKLSSGRETSIVLSDDQIAQLENSTMTHNHPINGAPLSWADVGVAIKGDAKEVRSISKDGWVSSLKAPGGSWRNAPGGVDGAYKEAVTPAVVFGAMRADSQKAVNQLLNDSWNELATKTGATYTFEKRK